MKKVAKYQHWFCTLVDARSAHERVLATLKFSFKEVALLIVAFRELSFFLLYVLIMRERFSWLNFTVCV